MATRQQSPLSACSSFQTLILPHPASARVARGKQFAIAAQDDPRTFAEGRAPKRNGTFEEPRIADRMAKIVGVTLRRRRHDESSETLRRQPGVSRCRTCTAC